MRSPLPQQAPYLTCTALHNHSPRMIVCLKPSCMSKCLVCPMCAEYEHNGPLHVLRHLDEFKEESLKILSYNAGNPDRHFLEALKRSKGNILDKIKQIQISMSCLIKKLRYAVNNQFQTLIKSYDPNTYTQELASLQQNLTDMKIINTVYKIEVLKRDEFEGKVENIVPIESKYMEIFNQFKKDFAGMAASLEKLKYVADLKFSEKTTVKIEKENRSFETQNAQPSSQNSKFSEMTDEKPIQKPHINTISIDSSSSSSSSPSRSRDKCKKQSPINLKPKKINPCNEEERKVDKIVRKDMESSIKLAEKKVKQALEKKKAVNQQRKHMETQQKRNKSTPPVKLTQSQKPSISEKPVQPFLVQPIKNSTTAQKVPEPKLKKPETQVPSKLIQTQPHSTHTNSGQSKIGPSPRKQQSGIPFIIHETVRAAQKLREAMSMQPREPVTAKETKQPKDKIVDTAPTKPATTAEGPKDPRVRKIPSAPENQPPKQPQTAPTAQNFRRVHNIKRPLKKPTTMSDEQLIAWFKKEYEGQTISSMILSHKFNKAQQKNQYFWYYEGNFEWKTSEYLRFVEEGPRIDHYRESLKYYK